MHTITIPVTTTQKAFFKVVPVTDSDFSFLGGGKVKVAEANKDDVHCFICGNSKYLGKFEFPGKTFVGLEGEPFICSKCLFERLTGSPAKWDEGFINEYRKFFNL